MWDQQGSRKCCSSLSLSYSVGVGLFLLLIIGGTGSSSISSFNREIREAPVSTQGNNSNSSDIVPKVEDNRNSSALINSSTVHQHLASDIQGGVTVIKSKPPDLNYDPAKHKKEEIPDSTEEFGGSSDIPGQPKFDENAVQRALLVVIVLAFSIVVYLGIKFMLIKKKKVSKNHQKYGRIESEIDLLDEDDGESDEEEELFDVNTIRRNHM